MIVIKVLGSGCENCQNVEKAARAAVAALGVEAEIVHVTQRAEIFKYPILGTPGLVINEKVVSAARIPSVAEVQAWLSEALQAN